MQRLRTKLCQLFRPSLYTDRPLAHHQDPRQEVHRHHVRGHLQQRREQRGGGEQEDQQGRRCTNLSFQ